MQDSDKGEKEKSAGMQDSEKVDTTKPDLKATWRHFMILPVIASLMFALVLNGFVQGEWIQKVIRAEHLPNGTGGFSGCGSQVNVTEEHEEKLRTVQQIAARWSMLFSLAGGIPNAIVTLFLPSYTDALGRKFLIILSIFGMSIGTVVSTLVIYFEASFWYIFASNIVLGFTGSMYSLFSAGFAMVADLTKADNQRTIGIVVMDVFLLVPIVIASYCSGLFVETLELDFLITSVIGSSVSIVSFLLTFVLQESHAPHKRSKRQPLLTTIKRMTDFYISDEFKGSRKAYNYLLFAFGFATLAGINRGGMETLYFLGKPFCWGPSQIGIFSMARNAAQAFIGLGSIRFLQMCMSNASIGVLSTLSITVSYIIEALATSTVVIYIVPAAGMFSFLVIPMIRSLISSITAPDKIGAVFASIAVIEVICTIAANLSQNAIYSFTMSFWNGFVFIICAILALINMLLMIGFQRAKKEMDKKEISNETSDLNIKSEITNTEAMSDYGSKL